jgi:molecular chaperone DnaK (HSP70)
MRLGIDFGTTRTRVAAAIKGNYPLIEFRTESGYDQNWYPSLIAVRGQQITVGLEAQAVQYDSDWELCRSFKRFLSDGHPHSVLSIGQVKLSLLDWLTQFLLTLRDSLLHHSNLAVDDSEPLQVMVGIPTNANSNQRFMTLESFRRAGFEVLGMLNEPSAAGIEYAHRYRQLDMTRWREHLLVYDLGGGTFDVSVIRISGQRHEVIGSEGISRLGGDDFDELLMELALSQPTGDLSIRKNLSLAASGIIIAPFTSAFRSRLLNLCREAKEGINPSTRKIMIDFGQTNAGAGEVLVQVSQFYEKCEPLILQTIQASKSVVHSVLGESATDFQSLACVYLVGGSCDLPILARSLKEHFGKRVRRSPYPAAATAIGLAIAADQESGYSLEEQFSRFFGVWRESDEGSKMAFDPIFAKQTVLPAPGQPPLRVTRTYHPVHNVGHFRFLECSHLKNLQEPNGDIVSWDEVFFPLNPSLREESHLEQVPVQRWPEAESLCVEEAYQCDAQGIIEVTISNQTTGHAKRYRLRQG